MNSDVGLEMLDESTIPEEEVYELLLGLPGVGPFSNANMLQRSGCYSY